MILQLKQISSLERVFLDSDMPENETNADTALKGERFSYQIAYCSDSKCEVNVSVESELAEFISVRYVGNVPSEYTIYDDHDEDYERTSPGLFPDVLFPIKDGKLLVKRQCRYSVWITVELPDTVEAGNYEIKVTFSNDEICEAKTFKLTVLDATLPEQQLIYTQWFHADCISDYFREPVFTERYWKLVEEFMKTAVHTGINMIFTPIFTPPLDTKIGGERTTVQLVDVSVSNGRYTFEFDKLRRWIKLAKSCGMKYFEISHLFSQWGAVATPKIIADGKKIFGWETSATSDEYVSFLHMFLPELIGVLKEEGVDKNTFFHISDEPSAEQIESYKKAKNVVKDFLKDFPIIDALSEYEFYKDGVVDFPIPCTDCAETFIKNGYEHHWTYYCCGQSRRVSNRFFAMPLSRTRAIGFQLYLYQMEGFLQWGYNFYNSQQSLRHINPYLVTDADGAFPSGDAFMVYPYEDSAIESVRSEVFYNALQDMRALQFLEGAIGREAVEKAITDKFGKITFTEYPRGTENMFRMRKFVNELIEKIVYKRNNL